ncbi:MAG: hypothetical protein A2Z14_14450 [Chloroflexi bacterium RBG_16_48_8]|nr:MAG: hypothetical protein A2Z14_14450 [Chloroflexi bacterium RBG_16_48_8]
MADQLATSYVNYPSLVHHRQSLISQRQVRKRNRHCLYLGPEISYRLLLGCWIEGENQQRKSTGSCAIVESHPSFPTPGTFIFLKGLTEYSLPAMIRTNVRS